MPNAANVGRKISDMIFFILTLSLNHCSFSSSQKATASVSIGAKTITSHRMTTLTTIIIAKANKGIMSASQNTIFIMSSKDISFTEPLFVVIHNSAILRIDQNKAYNGHVMPVALVSSSSTLLHCATHSSFHALSIGSNFLHCLKSTPGLYCIICLLYIQKLSCILVVSTTSLHSRAVTKAPFRDSRVRGSFGSHFLNNQLLSIGQGR